MDFSHIKDNLLRVRERIEAARKRAGRGDEVWLVAVTKTHPAEAVRAAIEAGVGIVGENRVQEASAKYEILGDLSRWHLVGHLQRNKVKKALSFFEMIHSVDSLPLAREIDLQAGRMGKRVDILLQVNVGGETSKYGTEPGRAAETAFAVRELPGVNLCGLMTIPPLGYNPEESRPHFRALSKLRDELERRGAGGLRYLSMGMSDDFEVAIEEGAHFVRVGSAIFGERNYNG